MMVATRIGALLALLVFSTSTLAAPPVKFGVQVDLTGNGTVTSSPGGISCPTSCLAYFKQAATITLTAAPAAGETFLGWGGACSGTGSCTIPSIQGDVQVAAQFSSNGGGGGGGGMTMVPEGTEPNSLLYWNGVAWAELLPPADIRGQYVLKLVDGGLLWEGGCVSGLSVGDTGPAGGTVIYVNSDGCGGLEVAPDELFAGWATDEYCNHNLVGTARPIGTGKANTEVIVEQCDQTTAAFLSSNYSHNGYSDWYLPSYEELRLIFNIRDLIDGMCANAEHRWYWSSSESSASWNALALCCDPTTQWDVNKGVGFPVRPIRNF